jgi:hypothetical protein
MSEDQNNGGDGAAPRGNKVLSDDVIEQVKSTILHGVGYRRPPAATL